MIMNNLLEKKKRSQFLLPRKLQGFVVSVHVIHVVSVQVIKLPFFVVAILHMYTHQNHGRIQDFHFFFFFFFFLGGGRERCDHAHHGRDPQSALWPGSRIRLRALEALGGFDALSCYLSHIFRHSHTKRERKSRSNFRGGGAPVAPPLNPPLKTEAIMFSRSALPLNLHAVLILIQVVKV